MTECQDHYHLQRHCSDCINALEARVTTLEATIRKDRTVEEPEEWPKDREKTYYIDYSGTVLELIWDKHEYVNEEQLAYGNVFRTRKEAEVARDKIEALLKELKG